MKTNIKKLAAPVVGLAVLAAGIVSAAATDPIPNPLPNAVAGNVIKASDINDLATAVGILDERTAEFRGGNLKVEDDKFIMARDTVIANALFRQGGESTVIENLSESSNLYLRGIAYDSGHTEGNVIIADNGGNVGIGITNPSSKLHVVRSGAPDLKTRITAWGTTSYNAGIGGALISGTGDGASFETFNTGIESWYGIGFPSSFDGINRITFNARNGDIRTKSLEGTGNAFACVDATGTFYRSDTACN